MDSDRRKDPEWRENRMIVLSSSAIHLPFLSLLDLDCLGLHYNRVSSMLFQPNTALRPGLEEENQDSEEFDLAQSQGCLVSWARFGVILPCAFFDNYKKKAFISPPFGLLWPLHSMDQVIMKPEHLMFECFYFLGPQEPSHLKAFTTAHSRGTRERV